MVSAVHHEGKRLYELARLGQVVERQPRTVEIYALRLLDFEPGEKPVFTVHVECSKGTYIRTLCADIGAALNSPAHMTSLVRTRVGRFPQDEAISMEDVQSAMDDGTIADLLLTPDDALMDMPFVEVTAEDADRVGHGAILSAETIALPHPPLDVPIRIMSSDKELLGIGHFDSRDGQIVLRPDKVFAAQAT
jgi:tRNA pseudouridine55 synthase